MQKAKKYMDKKYFYYLKKENQPFYVKYLYHECAKVVNNRRDIFWKITFYIGGEPIYPGHNVYVRVSTNNWRSFCDTKAIWNRNENNKEIWIANYIVYYPFQFFDFDKIEFAVMGVDCNDKLTWDSLYGQNYYIDVKKELS